MYFPFLLVSLGLFAAGHAAPLSPESDMGNMFMLSMLEQEFNKTGCYKTCDPQCPNEKNMPTEQNLRSCVHCVMNCSPATACYVALGYTKEQLEESTVGLTEALYLDSCRIGALTMSCGMAPEDMKLMTQDHAAYDQHGCPDKSKERTPDLGSSLKDVCTRAECRFNAVKAAPACRRALAAMGEYYRMMTAWLKCPGAAAVQN